MKKHNACKTVLALLSTVFVSVFLFSCKSAPEPVSVDLLSLVDSDAAVYFFLPAENYKTLIQGVLTKKIDGLTEKDAVRLCDRLQDIYLASGKHTSDFQIAASASIPQFALSSALSEKNGWQKNTSSDTSVPYSYFTSANTPLELSFPTVNTALVSYDVQRQLSYFEKALVQGEVAGESSGQSIPEGFNPQVYEYLTEQQRKEIRFIAVKPVSFIHMLIGKPLNLALNSVRGTISYTPSGKEAALTIDLELKDPRAVKAALQVVKLAIFPVAAKISLKGTNHIIITDYTISWKELTNIITR